MGESFSLLWIALLLVTALTVLVVALRFGIKGGDDDRGGQLVALDLGRLRSSFRKAIATVEQNIAEHSKRYDIPWVVMLHDGSSATRPAIEACGIASVLAGEQPEVVRDGPRWHYFDRGVVIELESDLLDAPGNHEGNEKRWEELLALCGQYRPQRPFDSIVVSVPASLLADRTPAGRERLRHYADAASRRIWIAQNRYAMRFAVYVVISGCDDLPAFSSFADALPESMRNSMLGWSSPYQPAAIYQSNWVTQTFDQVEQNIADTTAELFASHTQFASAADVFLLPSRIAALRAGTADYLEAFLRPNAFHEPFFMRGIYFTGGAQQPVFLRDVIEKKVFEEFGLSRAAHSQRLARPIMSRVFRWIAVGLPLIYALGIVLTTVQLNRVLPSLAEGLEGLKRDTEYRSLASSQGERIEFDWYRKTALQLMVGLEELQSRRLSKTVSLYDPNLINPFMPGSWPIFDDVRARALQRICEEFAELAIHTLQQAIYRRTAELTNAPLNPVTNTLSGGISDCDSPGMRSMNVAAKSYGTLAAENLPEFAILSHYAADIGRIDANVSTMQHMKSPNKNSQQELRMLVLDMLGADLSGDLQSSINLFRDASQMSPMLIDRSAVSTATRCGFLKGMEALNDALFDENALIRSEEKVIAAKNTVLNLFGSKASPDSAELIAAYRKLLEALTDQKTLLAHGQGGWLLQDDMQLGASYDKLMQQFADNKLIGQELVNDVKRQAKEDFSRTHQRFLVLFGKGSEMAVTGGGKDGGLALSKDRLATLGAVEHILNQPFMSPAIGNALEVPARGTLLSWDNEQLSKAIKLADSRKKFLSDDLPKFPGDMQEAVHDAIDYQFALRLVDLISHAYSPVDTQSVSGDAARGAASAFELSSTHLKRLISFLHELGQDGEARSLQALLSNDAAIRLKLLNNELQDARPYSVADDLEDSKPEQRATLNLFGNGSADVPEYLSQQVAKIQAMSAQAQLIQTSLPAESRNGAELARWKSIARELDLYTAKDPKGSLGKLEHFLLDLGRELDAPACLAVLKANEPPKKPANLFAERHLDLHRTITRRCLSLDRRSFVEQWTAFANDFNRQLKSRRPFIGSRNDLRGADYAAMATADISEAVALLNRIPAVSAEIFARNNVPEGSILPIRDFAAQLAQVRQLTGALMPADPALPAGLDVNVRFRTNVNAELDGNKIIDWSISIGEQTLKLRDTPRSLRWKIGDPVRITLRFANDAPLLPRPDTANPYLEVSRKSAVFRFDGPWALLDMMQLLRSLEGQDARSTLLKLDVPVLNDAKDTAPRAKPVRVFMGVTLSEPGKTAPLTWPAYFPERAPIVER